MVFASPTPAQLHRSTSCRYLPTDTEWPSKGEWGRLNATIGGRLIRGLPLAQACHDPYLSSAVCANVQERWPTGSLYIENPVNVMSPYWLNNTCSPFSNANATCSLGNIASYAININDAATAAAGILFAKEKNIRLSIKNTGHDFLGRSSGKGSLALWTHNLKSISFTDYKSPVYKGPAVKLGAGVSAGEALQAVTEKGFRITVGYVPTVGLVGGFLQNGGYGPLGSSYGLGADNALEFEVVTTSGKHLTASPTSNSDLYWALSGGGSGNYALVLSVTVKVHGDGPVAGAAFGFVNTNTDSFWAAIKAWYERLLVLNSIPGFSTIFVYNSELFLLVEATLPGGSKSDINTAIDPFLQKLKALNLPVIGNKTTQNPTFSKHYYAYLPADIESAWPSNNSVGGQLLPRSVVQNNLTALISTYRQILEDDTVPESQIGGASNNLTHGSTGIPANTNAILPAWRDSLCTASAGIRFSEAASVEDLQFYQAKVNEWQDLLRPLSPNNGAYINEATFDNPNWKSEYFGANYDRLLKVKKKYDPEFTLWQHASVGADIYWKEGEDGRLCRV
ncbi:FAD binding domain-containing protein [Lophiotrema nucula]|uniref:FAD binding domain-containing protein n=1 Tax=Lophiotrema nucula TaxID=690887 RepID=A0A6A5ZMH3_9PLEO|nr:FAD binding domain-containing protein [Lophiotrema nucula]